jgi:hypothetical protein
MEAMTNDFVRVKKKKKKKKKKKIEGSRIGCCVVKEEELSRIYIRDLPLTGSIFLMHTPSQRCEQEEYIQTTIIDHAETSSPGLLRLSKDTSILYI